MNRTGIIILAFGLAAIIVGLYKLGQYLSFKRYLKQVNIRHKRFVEKMKTDKDFNVKVININLEPNRVITKKGKLIIDGIEYSNKNSFFGQDEHKSYIYGKKEDFFIMIITD